MNDQPATNLPFSNSWNQAVIAATVRAAADTNPDCPLGRVALQKVLYFLNRAGVPLQYVFEIHHYGPYCHDVAADVTWMQADDVLRDQSPKPEARSNYRPGPAISQLLASFSEQLAPYDSTIQSVVKELVPLKMERLELFATLDYLYRSIRSGGGSGPWKERVVDRFLEVKKDRFTRRDVETTYDFMVGSRMVEN